MKSRRYVRKEGKKTGRKGIYISLTWLLRPTEDRPDRPLR